MSDFTLRRNETPGKYEGGLAIDKHVHGLTLEGFADEETGDVSELGWFGLLRGKIELASDVDATPDERAYLASVVGAIVSEDNDGFVSVEYFDDIDSLDDRWGCIEEAYSEPNEEESEEDSEEDESESAGCDSCQMLMINGVRCHETGCPDSWRDRDVDCSECGCHFRPEGRFERVCPDCANPFGSEEDSDSDDGQLEEDDARDNDNLGV